ncbi:hypothetical protein AAF712_011832 [Marasmius tenuissimus]|uniref:AB hydrolase-1 domain-containing protein n=1 Tax=Marasmius tenuissimus TaxID=585030 RepID=A0ABR2ZIZ8_9AGAR
MTTSTSITFKNVTSSDGGTIYAESIGDPSKPALILIPGWTMPSFVFDKQFEDEELRRELHLIRYDPRGHGRSVMPETEEGHASKLYADDFRAVCEAFEVQRPAVGAWSLAGVIICDICEHLGHEYISGVIYMGSIPYLSSTMIPQVVPANLVPLVEGLITTSDVASLKTAVIGFGRSLFIDPESIPFQTRLAWMAGILLQPPAVTQLVLLRKQDPSKLFEAGREGLKVFFLQGSDDAHRKSRTVIVDLVGEHFPQKEVAVIEGTGHAFFYEKPGETNRLLLDWTRKVVAC